MKKVLFILLLISPFYSMSQGTLKGYRLVQTEKVKDKADTIKVPPVVVTNPSDTVVVIQPGDTAQVGDTVIINPPNNPDSVVIPPHDTATVPSQPIITYPLSFTLPIRKPTRVSIGVFDSDRLIRTIESNVVYGVGDYPKIWDGLDDNANPVNQTPNIKVRALKSNVTYKWLGVVGNTSDDQLGDNQWHAHEVIQDVAIIGTKMYVVQNYNEKRSSIGYTYTTNPQKYYELLREGAESENLTDDGVNIYYTARDSWNRYKSFVYAIKHSDNTEVAFSAGQSFQTRVGRNYSSVIDLDNQTPTTGAVGNPPTTNPDVLRSEPSGIAVQRGSNPYLFVARKIQNRVSVLNKLTGQLVGNNTITSPRRMYCSGSDIWMISGTATVAKYAVNPSNGAFSSPILTLAGLVAPLSVTVSGNLVVVNDGGTSQQVKAYNATTGSLVWTRGTLGGYIKNASVNDNKFCFNSIIENNKTFTIFQPDGTYWVGDPGCNRIQHYDASGNFINRVMYIIKNYSARVDPNDVRNIYAGYLQFRMDYTKPIEQSWTLAKNWATFFNTNTDDQYSRLMNVVTLTNGRTYAVAVGVQAGPWKRRLFEMTAADTIRYTGKEWFGTDYLQIYPDGSLRRMTKKAIGDATRWYESPLTGFTANNPVWGTEVLKASTPPQTLETPGFTGNTVFLKSGERTLSGKYITYNVRSDNTDTGFHLGAVKAGTNIWTWLTSKATAKNYRGAYPTDASFDIGNGVQNAGSVAIVLGNNIIEKHIDEFRKGSQSNKSVHYNENGLMMGTYGWVGGEDSVAIGDAGNNFAPSVFMLPGSTSKAIEIGNDESHHGGIHETLIDSIDNFSIDTISFVSLPVIPVKSLDLLSELKRYDTLTKGKGWYKNQPNSSGWQVRTNLKTYGLFKSPDISVLFSKDAGTYFVLDTMRITKPATDYTISGMVSFEGNTQNRNTSGLAKSYYSILDTVGKTLLKFETFADADFAYVRVNNVPVLKYAYGGSSQTNYFRPFSFQFTSTGIAVNYGGNFTMGIPYFDNTANYTRPKYQKFEFTGGKGDKALTFDGLKFLSNN